MNHKVIVTEGNLVLPTYDLKGENRNPVFHSQYGVAHIYPYTLQDHIDFNVKEKQYRVLTLENRFLKVTIIPDLGGRVYSVFDKISDREVFYKNSVVKFSPLAIRGAFFSGGVEFSFPVAHAPTTCDKVNWDIRENEDGSASVSIGGIEHISRLKWMITLTLYPDRCALSQDVYLKNPNSIPGRYHYWTNASLDADDKTEFIYPFHRSRSYEYAGSASWPMARIDLIQGDPILPGMEGVPMWPANNLQTPINFRWQKNMLAQVSIFGRDIEWDYFGAWQHSVNHGYAHVAKPEDVSGMKLWSWGNLPVGVVNQTALTDDGSEYAETQCGAMETQLDFDFMKPYGSRQWREWWLPLREMGGLTCASEFVGARLHITQASESDKIVLKMAVCPAITIDQGTIKVSVLGGTIYENTLSCSPEQPWHDDISLSASIIGDQPLMLTILDHKDQVLLDYVNARDPGSGETENRDDIDGPETADGFYLSGINHENFDNRAQAKAAYEKSIDLDAGHKDSHLNYGRMLLRSAQFGLADEHLSQAQQNGSGEAAYFRGVIALLEDRLDDAKQYFDDAINNDVYGAASIIGLGKIALRIKDWQKAIDHFEKAKSSGCDQSVANLLLAVAFRRADKEDLAEASLIQCLTIDPLIHLALNELSKLNTPDSADAKAKLERILEDDYQYYIDLACDYIDLGLIDEASEVLETAWDKKPYALYAYLLAFLYEKNNERPAYALWLEKAQTSSLDFVLPSRLEEVIALNLILDQESEDDRIRYLLGNFFYAHERYDEAITYWNEALRSLNHYDVIHRNLGLAYWEHHGDFEKAIGFFEDALRINPENQDLYLHLDDLYLKHHLDEKRESLLRKIEALTDVREDIRKRRIKILVDLGYYEKALDILTNEVFLPLEMDQSFHDLYVRALMMRAEKSISQGKFDEAIEDYKHMLLYPDNLGVGRPTMRTHAQIYYLLGHAYEKIGKYKEALNAWFEGASEHHHSEGALFKFVQMSLDKISRYSELGLVRED